MNHDHFFSYRIDLDVDGQNNSLMVHRLVEKELPADGPRKSIWVAEPFIAAKERDAMMDIHLDKPTMWLFVNPNVRGPLGHPTGYEIMPGMTAASLLNPEDGVQKAGAFSAHQLWVTPYRPGELYAGGVYPNSSKGDDGLAAWTKENRSIENTDIVAWYTLGFHHVPREEDWPVMPVMWHFCHPALPLLFPQSRTGLAETALTRSAGVSHQLSGAVRIRHSCAFLPPRAQNSSHQHEARQRIKLIDRK